LPHSRLKESKVERGLIMSLSDIIAPGVTDSLARPGGFMKILYIALLVMEVLLAISVIGLVLIHPPKGDGMGAIGSAATMFTGGRGGAEAGLDKVTWIFVGLFMLLCLVLGFGFVTP
jgi:preprotein translocase subunit SecG